MNAKKILASILASALVATSLIACTKKPDESITDDTKEPVINEDTQNKTDIKDTEKEASTLLTFEELDALIEEKVGKTPEDNLVVMTLGDYNITYSEYRYYYVNYVKQFANFYGVDWDKDEKSKEMFNQYFTEAIKMNALVTQEAKDMGISLTKQEFDEYISGAFDTVSQQFGEDINDTLDKTYSITPFYMMMNETIFNFYLKMNDQFFQEGGEKYETVRKETLDFYTQNDYVRAKHVLIQFPTNEDGSPATEEQKAATLAKAEEVYQKAIAGTDFDELIKEYNEDPGAERYVNGYYFGKDQMVKPFEDMAYSLKEGEIGKPVETDYGYHVILRLPIDDDKIVSSDKYGEIAGTMMDAYFAELIESSECVKVENFDTLVKPVEEEAKTYMEDLRIQMEAAGQNSENK